MAELQHDSSPSYSPAARRGGRLAGIPESAVSHPSPAARSRGSSGNRRSCNSHDVVRHRTFTSANIGLFPLQSTCLPGLLGPRRVACVLRLLGAVVLGTTPCLPDAHGAVSIHALTLLSCACLRRSFPSMAILQRQYSNRGLTLHPDERPDLSGRSWKRSTSTSTSIRCTSYTR